MNNLIAALLHPYLPDTLAIRAFFISFAYVLALTPPEKTPRGYRIFLFRGLIVYAASLLASSLCFSLLSSRMVSLFWFPLVDFIRNFLVLLTYALFLCPYPRVIKCACAGSICAFTCVCVDLNYSLGHIVDMNFPGFTLPMQILIHTGILAFSWFMSRHALHRLSNFPRFGAALLICANFLIIGTALATQLLDTAISIVNLYSIIVYLILAIFTFVCYLCTFFICVERDATEKYKVENMALRAASEQMALSHANLRDLRRIRHDLKNAYAYMEVLLQEQKYQELSNVLRSFSPASVTTGYYVDCGNKDIAAILTAESSKAQARGMQIQHTLIVPPVLPFENGELFSILSNLIENAIESNLRYNLKDDITVQINLREQYLYICVTNKLPENADAEGILQLKTKKDHPEEHGLGTQIVQRLAQKYRGYFLTEIQNGRFLAEVLLDMLYQEGETAP